MDVGIDDEELFKQIAARVGIDCVTADMLIAISGRID